MHGEIVGKIRWIREGEGDPLTVGTMTLKLAIERPEIYGYKKVVFESDNSELVRLMNNDEKVLPRDHVGFLCKTMKGLDPMHNRFLHINNNLHFIIIIF